MHSCHTRSRQFPLGLSCFYALIEVKSIQRNAFIEITVERNQTRNIDIVQIKCYGSHEKRWIRDRTRLYAILAHKKYCQIESTAVNVTIEIFKTGDKTVKFHFSPSIESDLKIDSMTRFFLSHWSMFAYAEKLIGTAKVTTTTM